MNAADLYQAIGNVKIEYLEESEQSAEGYRTRAGLRVFLVAVATIVLCGVTALAVAISLREAARADMGVSEESPIPEWTEYNDMPQTDAEKQDAQVTLLASMCAGDQLYAYVAISPVSDEIAGVLAADSPQYEWDLSGSNTKRCSWFVEQAGYDSETKTALVKVSVRGEEIPQIKQVEFKLALTHNLREEEIYGPVVIAVTESREISRLLDVPVENTKAHFEAMWGLRSAALNIPDYSLKGSLNRIVVCAGYIEVELENPGLEQWITVSNADRIEIEGDSDAPFDTKEWFIKRLFCGSWQVSVNEILQGAAINYKDGTSAVIDEIPSAYAGIWTIMDGAGSSSVYEGRQTYRFTPKQAFDLRAIESVTIGNKVYSFSEFID